MNQFITLPLLILFSLNSYADTWEFSEKVPVTTAAGDKVFHHIDSSGRRNIAVSGNVLAVTWEDNRRGQPQVFVAFKALNKAAFTVERQLSTGAEAYDPTLVPLPDGGFIVIWEQDGNIHGTVTNIKGHYPPTQLSKNNGTQASLAMINPGQFVVAWSRRGKQGNRIYINKATPNTFNGQFHPVTPATPVDPSSIKQYTQTFPVVSVFNNIITVIWEDRRAGHTTLLYSTNIKQLTFNTPTKLNEVVKKSTKYGRGSGVMRVALTTSPVKGLVATWMDKRSFKTAYDIYAAFDKMKEPMQFGKNELVQDDFAENIPQWNPTIAPTLNGQVAIAWEDSRDETMDIWLSTKGKDGWSEDNPVEPASGELEQTNPSLTSDPQGNLHLIWIETAKSGGATRLYYTNGSLQKL